MQPIARLTRRNLLTRCTTAAAAASAIWAPSAAVAADENAQRPLRILVAGAHPGDPEAGCGGTMARYTQLGHEVTALYLTRGEGGIPGKTAEQAAGIRSAEALAACAILKAKAVFAGQIDAATEINPARIIEFTKLIEAAQPDVVFTQWPVDTHPDHRVCASLTIGAWVSLKRKFALYYYEVDLGGDTQCFHPTDFVDITDAEPLKRQACMAHQSQGAAGAEGFYFKDHVPMMHFRGMECGRKNAEAFMHHDPSPVGRLPGM